LTPELTPEGKMQDLSNTSDPTPLPPELVKIVDVWADLPEHIKAAIMALVKTRV